MPRDTDRSEKNTDGDPTGSDRGKGGWSRFLNGIAIVVAGGLILNVLWYSAYPERKNQPSEAMQFAELTVDWYRFYRKDGLLRQAPLRPSNHEDRKWLGDKVPFEIRDINLEVIGFKFAGYDIYPRGSESVLVQVFYNGDDERLIVCLSRGGADVEAGFKSIGTLLGTNYHVFPIGGIVAAVISDIDHQQLEKAEMATKLAY